MMKDIVSVPQEVITNATDYLLRAQKSDGSFVTSQGIHTPFPALLTPAATSIFIFQAITQAGVINKNLCQWVINNFDTYSDDVALVAMALDSVTRSTQGQENAAFTTKLYNLILSKQNTTGGWEPTASSLTCSKESIETTAYALLAINRASLGNPDNGFIAIDRAVEFLLSRRRKTGWQSTRDTLYATLAFAEIRHLSLGCTTETFDIVVNGKKFKSFEFTEEMSDSERIDLRYQLRRVVIDPLHLQKGKNTIQVTSGPTSAQVLIERETYPELQQNQGINTISEVQLGTIAFKPTTTKLKLGETLDFSLSFTATQPNIQALMIECPIPSGFDLLSSMNSIKQESSAVIDHIEVKQIQGESRLCCHASLVNLHEIVTIQAKLLAKFKGDNIQVNPCTAYPMYRPDDIVQGGITLLVVG